MSHFTLKKDKYKSARGGHSRLLNIHCYKCNNLILVYQKDGPGNIRRLYLDRIFSPEKLVGLQKQSIKSISPLKCPKCGFVVGFPYVYEKEHRKAFRVFQDALTKKVRKVS
jgi:ribosomal protein S27E